jgi:SNF2 family DNA or RNA helicase
MTIDELAVYRNGGTDRPKALAKRAAKMRWVWGMTGEPIPNSPTDVWSQAKIVTPGTVTKFFGAFRNELMVRSNHSQFQWFPRPDAVERAFNALQPAVRYTLEDVTELPEFIERVVDIEIGPEQKKIYKSLVDTCRAMSLTQEITAANAGVAMNKLLQVSLGWVYARDPVTKEQSIVALDNTHRLQTLIDSINASNRKVLVFVPFKHALEGISTALTKEKIEHACVSGDTAVAERGRIFGLFQNTDKFKVIAAHPQCLAHGLTLTAADTVIWFGPITSLETYNQANARIRRVGQKHKQLYLKFQGTPVEKKIYAMLDGKQNVQARLLELFEEASE